MYKINIDSLVREIKNDVRILLYICLMVLLINRAVVCIDILLIKSSCFSMSRFDGI